MYVAKAPGQQMTDAQTRTPLLGPTGPACTLSFDFALIGNLTHVGERPDVSFWLLLLSKRRGVLIFFFSFRRAARAAGELSIRVIDSVLGLQPKAWEFTGKTGTDEEAWREVSLTIGARQHRFQVSPSVKTPMSPLVATCQLFPLWWKRKRMPFHFVFPSWRSKPVPRRFITRQ